MRELPIQEQFEYLLSQCESPWAGDLVAVVREATMVFLAQSTLNRPDIKAVVEENDRKAGRPETLPTDDLYALHPGYYQDIAPVTTNVREPMVATWKVEKDLDGHTPYAEGGVPRLEALNAAMEAERAKAGSDAAGADDAALLERLKAAGWTHTLGGWLTPEETHSKRGKRRLANVASKVAADKRKRTGGNGAAEEAAVDAASDGLAEQVTRVQKRFSDGELYEGTLMHYRPGDAHPYRVEYDDGDTETYTTAEWRKEVKVQRGTCAEI